MSQILVPHSEPIPRASAIRSTLLQGSLRALRENHMYERWLVLVDPAQRDAIIEAIAPTWLPIEIGLAHYLACDELGVDEAQLVRIGEAVGARLQSTLLGVGAKLAHASGLSNTVMAQCFEKLWPRLIVGGSVQLELVGPKDLVIELRAGVLPRSSYFRGTFIGNVKAAAKLVGLTSVYAKQLTYSSAKDRFAVQMSWV